MSYIQEGGTDREPFPGGQNRMLIHKAEEIFADETEIRLPLYYDMSHGCAVGTIDNDGDGNIYNSLLQAETRFLLVF
ncbi:hypothetical protein N9933_02950 [bacterium]|nr:hypothetical protein [bacterium]